MKRMLLALLLALVSPVSAAHAQWQSEDPPLSLTPPAGWDRMSEGLLAETNRTVRHVTEGPFIVGYQAYEADTLLFPYLLVQYTSYESLAEEHRPTFQLDERGMLALVGRLVRSWNVPDELPEGMDVAGFGEAYGNGQARLVSVDAEGRFTISGALPLRDGSGQTDFVTVGRLGREGVAYATVFTNEGAGAIREVARGPLDTLAFAEGAGLDGLPERDTGVVGFLPPPAEPLPANAVLVHNGVFGFVPGTGYTPQPAGSFDPSTPLLTSALPAALRGQVIEQVLTRTPTSRRITHPWAASAFAPWATVGVDGPLARQPTQAEWASTISALIGLDDTVVSAWLGDADQDPARPEIAGAAAEGEEPWVLLAANTAAGRIDLKQSVMLEGEAMTRRLTLVVGVEGLAVFVSQAYADAGEDELAVLTGMADTMRFAGGSRLVDLPPVGEEGVGSDANGENRGTAGEGEETAAPGETLGAEDETTEGTSATANASGAAGDLGDDTRPPNNGSGIALPLIIGLMVVVFVGIAVAVGISNHKKAQQRREKARARRERQAGGAPATQRRAPASRPRTPRSRR